MKRGIYAGSFDPTTRGHLDVIRRASLIVDELHVMIGVNPKKSGGFFPVAKRLALIEGSLAHMAWFGRDRSAFHIGQFTGLLVDYCRQHDIRFNIRGLRAAQDFNYEFEMHGINCDIAPEINTVFLIAPPRIPVHHQQHHPGVRQLPVARRRQVRHSLRGDCPARRELGPLTVASRPPHRGR